MISALVYYVLPTITVLLGIRKYQEYKWGSCNNNIKLTGQVVIVTGANSGIGYQIAKELAKREAKVILACRSLDAASKAIYKIKRELEVSSVIVSIIRSKGNFIKYIHF